ncbi:MAG TPA: hypothetical protein VFJ66_06065 [Gaiellales bacterium]|nr:hypothetical protein [Gaiellales bacterium]
MARDPEIERVHEALATTGRDEAERAITAGAALAVILAVAALIAVLVAVFWLFA